MIGGPKVPVSTDLRIEQEHEASALGSAGRSDAILPGALRTAATDMKPRSWFYTAMGLVALIAVFIGFGRTYAAPMMRGEFAGPRILHIHGAFALVWVLLFLGQPLLLRWRGVAAHRALGAVGLPVALIVAITMIPAGLFQVERDLSGGSNPTTISTLLGVVTSSILFVALVAAGIVARRSREAHARWLLLATLLVIWPAWFRFRHWFPQVPRPDQWFGVVLPMSWVVVAMIRDRVVQGAVHPVLRFAGTGLIVEQGLELLSFDTPLWRAMSNAIFLWLRQ